MTPEEFRRYGHEVVDRVAEYWERVGSYPVRSPVSPGDVRAGLPQEVPERGEPFDAVLADFDRAVLPGLSHWQHPSFFAYYPGNTTGPAVLGELLSAGLAVQGMLWVTGPACTELETLVLDQMAGLLGLPDKFRSDGPGGGVIQDTTSSAVLVALTTALHRATGGASDRAGLASLDGPFTVYASEQAHSCLEKAARINGIGKDNVRLVPVDKRTQAMRTDALAEMLAADVAAGATPVMVMATVGTTSTAAVDPTGQIAELCKQHGAWLHVDAAYAGVAAVCPELRSLNDGIAEADSYSTNPHKWLLTNFDCCTFWVADRAQLVQALSVLPEFLRNAATATGEVIDYRDWQIPLGRRFRALKLWFTLRWYGVEGLRDHIRTHVALAEELAGQVAADDRFELPVDQSLSLVCFRLRGGDELNEELLERLNASGKLYCSHTKVNGAYTIRFAIGAVHTGREHVQAAWRAIQDEATALLART